MAIQFTLYRNANRSNQLNGAYPLGNAPASPLYYNGTPSQLGTISIGTDGTYDFGTRSNQSQIWWQVGDRAWDKNGEVALAEADTVEGEVLSAGVNATAFTTCTDITARRGNKAGLRSNFAYEGSQNGHEIGRFVASPINTPTTTRKAFFGFTGRWTDYLNRVATSSYSSLTGNFDDGDNTQFIKGETFTGVKSGSGAFTGHIIKEDTANGVITFYTADSYNSTDNNGATITGDVSGAQATFDGVVYLRPAALKIARCDTHTGATPTSPEVAIGFTQVQSRQLILQTRTSTTGTDDYRPNSIQVGGSGWENWNFQADWSGSNLLAYIQRDGDVYTDTLANPNALDLSNVPYELNHTLLCTDFAGSTNPYGHLFAVMKDPHCDYELNRVVLGDNATFANCSNTAVCRSESWNTTSTTVRLNFGEIPSSTETFAFVFDGSGTCLNPTSGLSIGNAP